MASVRPDQVMLGRSKPSMESSQDEELARSRKHKRNINLALQHAFLIQHRKDVEAQILESIEELADIPEAALVSQKETVALTSKLPIFQPSDFDDLVAERIAQSRCGYTLCSQKPRSSTMRTWNLAEGAADFCSGACQIKAAYIRSQLDPIPAWERSPSQHVRIVLRENVLDRPKQASKDAHTELAFERGEKVTSRKPEQVMSAEIVEKTTKSDVQVPPQMDRAITANAIEGYVPRTEEDAVAASNEDTKEYSQQLKPTEGDDDEEQQWNDMFTHLQK